MSAAGISRRLLAGGMLAALGARPVSATTFCRDEGGAPARDMPIATPLGQVNRRVGWGVAMAAPAYTTSRYSRRSRPSGRVSLAVASGLKFGSIYPENPLRRGAAPAPPQWWETDDVLALARRLGVPVRGDALAWNDSLPGWVTDLATRRPAGWQETLRRVFAMQFEAAFGHLEASGVPVAAAGLVNEPFQPWSQSRGVPAWRPGPWLDAFGSTPDGTPRYIAEAFALGERLAAPGTVLILNEAFCENDRFGPLLRPAMLRLLDSLQAAGRRVDAVGFEAHLMPQWMSDPASPDWRPFVAFLRDVARRGVAIHLTELDVNDCSLRDRAARDRLVATYIGSFLRACLEVPAVTAVTSWDLSDGFSWMAENTAAASTFNTLGRWASCAANPPPCPRPTLYDGAMRPKAARDALARALAEAPR